MNLRYSSLFGAAAALLAGGAMLAPATARAQETAVPDMQILTRGPVHEAFAETVSFDPQAGLIVRAAPPNPIEELPPEQQLEGDNVAWIPGYWAWDDERNDFLWISGIWRNLPPGRQWIPGYWSDIGDNQFQWTSGYWADSMTVDVNYIGTAPPPNLDVGPNIPAPSPDQNWIPGNWVWGESRYLWRPGYWLPLRTNWTWVPSRYNWNRRGYVYVDGYWDYDVANRGVLFAPVYFNSDSYAAPDYYYTPSIVIALNVFAEHLFVRPGCGHYYFGDYYAPRYRNDGYYASYSWHCGRRGYDPIYAYDRWQHRGDRGWEGRRQTDFDYFRDHESARPRHTWAEMREGGSSRYNDGRSREFATPLERFASTQTGGQRFQPLTKGRREQLVSQGREVRNLSRTRSQLETRTRDAGGAANRQPTRAPLTRSPIIGRPADRLATRDAPPRRPEARGSDIRPSPATRARPESAITRPDASRSLSGRQGPATGTTERRAPGVRTPQPLPGAAATSPGATRDRREPNVARQAPARQTGASTPQRQVQPSSPARQAPQRQVQPAPQRQAPQRQVQPAPQRQAPQRQVQPAPQRQAPRRQVQPARQRQAPQRQVQPAPQRQAPQRQAQPAPQRQAPPRQAQPMPQRQAPQRQAQPMPQRQAPPAAQRQAPPAAQSPGASEPSRTSGRTRR